MGDDLVDFWRKTKADMGGADFDVLHVRAVLIDTSLPGNDTVGARVNRGYRRAEQNLIAQFNLGDNRLNVDAASMKPPCAVPEPIGPSAHSAVSFNAYKPAV